MWPTLYELTNSSCIIASSLCITGIHGAVPSYDHLDINACPRFCFRKVKCTPAHRISKYLASNSSLLPVEFDNSFSRKLPTLEDPRLPLTMSAGGFRSLIIVGLEKSCIKAFSKSQTRDSIGTFIYSNWVGHEPRLRDQA